MGESLSAMLKKSNRRWQTRHHDLNTMNMKGEIQASLAQACSHAEGKVYKPSYQ
jgi:hypothetical protein